MGALGRCALAGLVVLLVPAAASAQRAQTREGFWIGFGIGYGSASADCDSCGSGDRQGDLTGLLKLGGTYSDRVLLGGEVNVWSREETGATVTLGNVTGTVYYYPRPSSGLFVKGGVGFALATAEDFGETLEGIGWGVLAGAGYDLRVGRKVSLTPSASFYFGQPGDLQSNRTTLIRGWKQNVFDFTIGVTFH